MGAARSRPAGRLLPIEYNVLMKKTVFTVSALLVAAGAAFWFWWRPDAAGKVNYLTEPARRGTLTREVVAVGKMDAVELVSVGAQVSGQIKKLHVKLGQQVKQGDLVAEIDSTSQLNQYNADKAILSSYQAQLVAKEAALRIAQTRHEREAALRKREATSREIYEDAVNNLALAKAEVAQVQAQIRQTELALATDELNLSYTRIVAPLDGTVVAVVVDEGQTVNANQTTPTIVQIADLKQMENSIEISEGDIGVVRVDMPVRFTILSMPDKAFDTRISSLDPGMTTLSNGQYGRSSSSSSTSSSSGSSSSEAVYFYGKARVDNTDGILRIGMSTENTITVATVEDSILVPITALTTAADSSRQVEVLTADGKPEKRRVETGLADGVHVQITSGLQEGEKVVIGTLTQEEIASERAKGGPGGPR